jgi:lipopolysaccharide transport system ATP-binding protein
MPRIEIQNLTKIYPLDMAEAAKSFRQTLLGRHADPRDARGKTAVADLSLVIEAGERVGIVGPNGAGKSTFLHMVAGTAQATSGRLAVDGKVTSILTLGIGLRDQMSGRDNIYLDGELQGKTRQEVDEVIGAVIEFAELGEFIDRPVRTYSTGMKSRLAFAMISHIDPEILLIDEALSVGDAAFSAKASRRIREICAKGRIVVVVSHSLGAINDICSRCLWMDGGRIVMDGRPDEVTQAYAAAVHERDDEDLLRRFKSLVGAESLKDGCAIDSLEMLEPDGAPRRAASRTMRNSTRARRISKGSIAW